MILSEAQVIADKYLKQLLPVCERAEIAGSIRRRKNVIGDVEIVVIPNRLAPKRVTNAFAATVLQLGKILKGKPNGKYVQIRLSEGINLDLFIATKDNFGYIMAIRTGSSDYSRYVLAGGWVKAGYKGEDGMLTKDGIPIPVREEEDLFKLIGVKMVPPMFRET